MNFTLRPTLATVIAGLAVTLALQSTTAVAQRGQGPGGFGLDPRADDRSYHFADTDEDLPYCVFVSSKVSANRPAP